MDILIFESETNNIILVILKIKTWRKNTSGFDAEETSVILVVRNNSYIGCKKQQLDWL